MKNPKVNQLSEYCPSRKQVSGKLLEKFGWSCAPSQTRRVKSRISPTSTKGSPPLGLGRGAVADRGEGSGGPPPSRALFLDQTEAPKGRKNFFWDRSPLISGSEWPAPPPLYLKVWISRWGALWMFKTSALSGSVFIPNKPPKLKSCNLPFSFKFFHHK